MSARRVLALVLAGVGVLAVAVGVVELVDGDAGPSGSPSVLVAALSAATPARQPFPDLTAARIAVGGRCMRVVVADTLDERVGGLRERRDLGAYDGMLFVFDGATDTAFTMSTVPVPLEIGFYAGTGALVSTTHMLPCAKAEDECPVYRAGARYVFALETLGGHLPVGSLSGCA